MLALILILVLVLAAIGWLLSGPRGETHEPTVHRSVGDGVDHAELEEAERDAREADDQDSVRDWGPGTGKPRPPHLL